MKITGTYSLTLRLALVFAVLTFLKFWREERQKRFIHQAFARYVSPKVVSRIVARRGLPAAVLVHGRSTLPSSARATCAAPTAPAYG